MKQSASHRPPRGVNAEALEARYLLAFASDDFNAPSLNARWTVVNPVGDGTVAMDGTNALLSVPAGVNHDAWVTGNRTLRLMQPTPDQDFELEVKFDSTPASQYQLQGVIVEASTNSFIRLDYFNDGGGLRLFAASFTSGSSAVWFNQPAATGWTDASALYMRVRQQGDQWTQSYSYDGTSWTTAASFSLALNVAQVGVFAGNAGPSPAFTASVDYFFNTASPIANEDANYLLDVTPPRVTNLQAAGTPSATQISWLTNELTTGVVEYGLTASYGLGSANQNQFGTAQSLTLNNLQPTTTYHYRVIATNQHGLTTTSQDRTFTTAALSAQAPSIILWYGDHPAFGQLGNSQRWVNVVGRVSDPDGIGSLRYTLNGGPVQNLAVGPNGLRLERPGDFNVEIDRADLVAGANLVRITATDTLGHSTISDVTITFTPNQTWPMPSVVDWSSASSVDQRVQVVDGRWGLEQGGVRTIETGYDRALALGDVSWSDYEVVVPVTVHSIGPGSNGHPGFGVAMHWTGHFDGMGGQPRTQWYPLGALGWYQDDRFVIFGNGLTVLASDANPRPITFETTYFLKMRAESSASGGHSTYSMKVWPQGTTEPAQWDMTGTGIAGELTSGSILLTSYYMDLTFGNVSVTPLAGSAPLIQSVQAQPSTTNAQISWSTNEPTTGLVEYGLTNNYELGQVAHAVLGSSHSVILPGLQPNTTYHYHIIATDGQSNVTTSPDYTVTTLAADTTPPAISGITVSPLSGQLVVNWTTNELATGVVQYGLTGAYELGSAAQSVARTSHTVTLTGLSAGTTYHFRIVATDLASNSSSTPDQTATTTVGAFRSDDFSAGIDPALWTFVNPAGDAGTVSTDGSRLLISVPQGGNHDLWTGGNRSVRLMQPALNQDFELEAKFESIPAAGFSLQGLVIEASAGNYLRCDFLSDGTSLRAFVASFVNDSPTLRANQVIAGGAALYMRVRRVGNQWTQLYSVDGQNWTSTVTFSHTMAVNKVGAYAGNAGAAPAFTAIVDYFFDTANPIVPEDDNSAPPIISGVSAQHAATTALISWQTNEVTTGHVEYGLTGAYELGSVPHNTAGTSHSVTLTGLTAATTYHYRIVATDGNDTTTSGDFTVTTSAAGGPFSSDDFASGLNSSIWTFVNPVGDGSVTTDGTHALISVPAGVNHDAWVGSNRSARLMQTAADQDFELEVKFESLPTAQYSLQGLLVEAGANDYLRFDFFSDGGSLHVFCASFTGGAANVRHNQVIAPGSNLYMRIKRVGNQWTHSYSYDGSTWQIAGTFTQAMAVTKVGVFAGNAGSAPAFTAIVDYFFDTANPIVPEDDNSAPPIISGVSAQHAATTALISWQTNEVTTGYVEYGLTGTYELGSVPHNTAGTSHSVTLTGLTAATTYHYRIVATDGSDTTTSGDFTVTTSAATGPFRSDQFNTPLNTSLWTFVNPVGDGSVTTNGTHALIFVPAGGNHDVWVGSNRAARLMQSAADQDFELEVKFDSLPAAQFALQGLLIEADANNFLRFDFFSDGGSLHIFAASFANGGANVRYNQSIASNAALYMRIKRVGNQWTQSYSYNGSTWQTVGTFTHTLGVTKVGVFAGNAGPSPAFTASVDYFIDTAFPDPDAAPDTTPPLILNPQTQPRSTQTPLTWQTNEAATAVVQYGITNSYEIGSVNQSTLATNHSISLTNLQPQQTYHFRIIATDAAGNVTTSGDFTFTTAATEPPAFVSDDFTGALNTSRWSFVNPLGDGSVSTDGSHALLSVPAGVEHDVWSGGNRSVRLMQACANQDFEAEVKFSSTPTGQYALEGLVVEASPGTYLRYDFLSDGSSLRVFAATFVNNSPTVRANQVITTGAALYLRVQRVGNQWTLLYSVNGQNWNSVVSFSQTMAVTQVGVYAGNAGTAPAFTSVVDYFYNNSDENP